MKESHKKELIRKYLLGDLTNEAEWQEVEMRLLTEDEFEEEVLIYEDELVDDYLHARLSGQEKLLFEKHCLTSAEIREKIEFAQTFKTYLDEEQKSVVKPVSPKKSFFNWRFPQFAPVPAMALVLLLCGIGFAAWYLLSQQSDVDKGLIALQQAYKMKRPFEARISDFEYAPLNNTRGANETDVADPTARRLAEIHLLEAVKANKNAASHYALGKLYLADKDFEKAVGQFEQAIKFAPNDAKLHSDFGTALLQVGKQAATGEDGEKSLKSFARSLELLERAIELDPKLLAPRFNRALCLEEMFLPNQAKDVWREYLQLDSNSEWAEEARRNIERLETQSSQNKTSGELLDDFMAAFRNGDDALAWKIQSGNKEMSTGKLIPQQLALRFIRAATEGRQNEARELLQALNYSGTIEKTQIQDSYFSNIADYYSTVPQGKHRLLREAQNELTAAYELSLKPEHRTALAGFVRAQKLFIEAGNILEAKLIDYWIAYCNFYLNKLEVSVALLKESIEFCRAKNYKWLLTPFLSLLALNYSASNKHSQSISLNKEALSIAETASDTYNTQRILSRLANSYRMLGKYYLALNYSHNILQQSHGVAGSQQQKWRNYAVVVELLFALKFYSAAAAYVKECSRLAEELNERTFLHFSRLHTAIILSYLHKHDNLIDLLNQGRQIAESFSDEEARKKAVAFSTLHLAHLQRKAQDCRQALVNYDLAVSTYSTLEFKLHEYAARKGRLLCYFETGDVSAAQAEMPIIFKLFEQYRSRIIEEQNRNSFFDIEQDVYDIAVGYEYAKGDFERSFSYAENSRSRSLLDWLQGSAYLNNDEKKEIEVSFSSTADSLSLKEIQNRLPEQVQMVQYAVLNDKVLIWIISREGFAIAASETPSAHFEEKTASYLNLLASNDKEKQAQAGELSRELYRILISPIQNQLDPSKTVCFVPDKFLFKLPFAALLSPQSGQYLIENHNLIYAPSASIFVLSSEKARQKAHTKDEMLVSIGNPAFDYRKFAELSDLPSAGREAENIAAFYPQARVIVGRNARKNSIINAIQTADIVHFAGHYVVDEASPTQSRLLLASNGQDDKDDFLSGYELAQKQLPQTKLVILSACQTGVERYYKGEGMIGIARNFLAAGVPLVVASQWKVDSDATAALMVKFHQYRKQEKLSAAHALRRAQLDMLTASNENFRRPYYWAAFTQFGGYAEF